jgi:hypothetical protein
LKDYPACTIVNKNTFITAGKLRERLVSSDEEDQNLSNTKSKKRKIVRKEQRDEDK